jgi:hypothetical protein
MEDKIIAKIENIGSAEHKSKMTIGAITIYNTKHFNWLQKRMWKILLGIKIEDVEETNESIS